MGQIEATTLEEYEKKNIEWWCLRHKDNCAYLVIRMRQIINGDEVITKMMQTQLKDFARAAGVDLNEID